MPRERGRLLDPNRRSLYTEALRPPPGYRVDCAVAATYSLDLEMLLSIPVSLALFSLPDKEQVLDNKVLLLEALERTVENLAVFAQVGRIHPASGLPALAGLVEPCVHEVVAPHGGAFHPKLWLLRFAPLAGAGGTPRIRLLVLSRNLTSDRSWDLSLALDGEPRGRNRRPNRSLAELLRALPDLAIRPLRPSYREMIDTLADEVHRMVWEMPDGVEELSFEVLGLRRRAWTPPVSKRLVVVSPFCQGAALEHLAGTTGAPVALVSRHEELAALEPEARDRFERCLVLQDTTEVEDGEEIPQKGPRLHGLHAKLYLFEQGWDTTLVLGSANATNAALLQGRNVELLAHLQGRRSRIGGVSELLQEAEGFGALLAPFVPSEDIAESDASERAAKEALEHARDALIEAKLSMTCAAEDGDHWRVRLRAATPVSIGEVRLRIWLATGHDQAARDGGALTDGDEIDLGRHPLALLCQFVGFELSLPGEHRLAFTLTVLMKNLPKARYAAIVASVLTDRAGFLAYLRLLLGDLWDETLAELGSAQGTGAWWKAGTAGETEPLLENMVRALARDPQRLRAIGRVIERLEERGGAGIVPPEFRKLWEAFALLLAETKG